MSVKTMRKMENLWVISELSPFGRGSNVSTKWVIVRLIGEGTKSTSIIFEGSEKPGSRLCYHLSTLEVAGINEMAGYREMGGGAFEKVCKRGRRAKYELTYSSIMLKSAEKTEVSHDEREIDLCPSSA
jgi:hypothetical protein